MARVEPTTLVCELPSSTRLEGECRHCLRTKTIKVSSLREHAFIPIGEVEKALKCEGCGSYQVALFYDL